MKFLLSLFCVLDFILELIVESGKRANWICHSYYGMCVKSKGNLLITDVEDTVADLELYS